MYKSVVAAALSVLVTGAAAQAQDSGPLVSSLSLSPDMAHKLVMDTVKICRAQGFQITAAVVDRGGNLQALLKDQFAGEFTVTLSINKARTAASFNASTQDVMEATKSGSDAAGVRGFGDIVAVGGGLPIIAKGRTVGALAVSGGPDGGADSKCAEQALDDVMVDLEM